MNCLKFYFEIEAFHSSEFEVGIISVQLSIKIISIKTFSVFSIWFNTVVNDELHF